MNYVEDFCTRLAGKLPDCEPELLDLYTLLGLVRGPAVTNEDVHDAWAVWRNRSFPEHRSIVPFDHLTPDVQALDTEYCLAIQEVSASLLEPTLDRLRRLEAAVRLLLRVWRNRGSSLVRLEAVDDLDYINEHIQDLEELVVTAGPSDQADQR